ncbi:MAG: D-glycero-beta-D-manno-heptose-7-phosphate kinase [Bacteroidetes bacterium B1(2017)]|nr:MAG: D-glycero-beta-D-manno-heptose-7-phosphate kinase [Bacteroidetes bacterium B1(2017)]
MKNSIKKFEGLKVLVIGDVMIDAYLIGNVERISPEAPVPVVAVNKKDYRLGGAANVALNLVALGAKPILCSVIGDDFDGNELLQLLDKASIQSSGIIRSKERLTTTKTRVMAQNHQMIRIDNEQTEPISEYDTYVLVQRIINDLLPAADVVLFEDYDKGVISSSLIDQIVVAAHKHNIKVVVDPKKRNFINYKGVDLFKPNLKELKEGFKRDADPSDPAEFEAAIIDLMKVMELKNIMVTLSERGVMISDGTSFEYIPAHLRKIADVSGAGDTVISVASLCMALGMANKDIASLSNLAGGLVCEEVGVVPIDINRLITEAEKL